MLLPRGIALAHADFGPAINRMSRGAIALRVAPSRASAISPGEVIRTPRLFILKRATWRFARAAAAVSPIICASGLRSSPPSLAAPETGHAQTIRRRRRPGALPAAMPRRRSLKRLKEIGDRRDI